MSSLWLWARDVCDTNISTKWGVQTEQCDTGWTGNPNPSVTCDTWPCLQCQFWRSLLQVRVPLENLSQVIYCVLWMFVNEKEERDVKKRSHFVCVWGGLGGVPVGEMWTVCVCQGGSSLLKLVRHWAESERHWGGKRHTLALPPLSHTHSHTSRSKDNWPISHTQTHRHGCQVLLLSWTDHSRIITPDSGSHHAPADTFEVPGGLHSAGGLDFQD